jgi:hypothetical protein
MRSNPEILNNIPQSSHVFFIGIPHQIHQSFGTRNIHPFELQSEILSVYTSGLGFDEHCKVYSTPALKRLAYPLCFDQKILFYFSHFHFFGTSSQNQ